MKEYKFTHIFTATPFNPNTIYKIHSYITSKYKCRDKAVWKPKKRRREIFSIFLKKEKNGRVSNICTNFELREPRRRRRPSADAEGFSRLLKQRSPEFFLSSQAPAHCELVGVFVLGCRGQTFRLDPDIPGQASSRLLDCRS